MKKINILYTIWATSYGGAERFTFNLVKSLDMNKFNVIIFSDSHKCGPLKADFEKSGAKVICSKYHRFRHPVKYAKQLKKVIIDESVDIIHSNDDLNMIFPLLLKPRRTIFVAHSHSTEFMFTNNRLVSAVTASPIKHYIARHADIRLACGEDAGKSFFLDKPFRVVHNGIDFDLFSFSRKNRNEVRKKYGIRDDEVVLLNIGRLVSIKNQSFLIDMFSAFFEKNKNARLMIVGDGPEKQQLVQKRDFCNLTNNILILPGQANVVDFYNAADIFVMPSLFEGMPVVSIESQINGLRCLFADTITREADHFGDSKFLSLGLGAKVWADEILKMKLGHVERDLGTIEEYNIKTIAKQLSELYLKSIAKGNK